MISLIKLLLDCKAVSKFLVFPAHLSIMLNSHSFCFSDLTCTYSFQIKTFNFEEFTLVFMAWSVIGIMCVGLRASWNFRLEWRHMLCTVMRMYIHICFHIMHCSFPLWPGIDLGGTAVIEYSVLLEVHLYTFPSNMSLLFYPCAVNLSISSWFHPITVRIDDDRQLLPVCLFMKNFIVHIKCLPFLFIRLY